MSLRSVNTTTTTTLVSDTSLHVATQLPVTFWLVVLTLHAAGMRGAVASIMSLACSNVCGHGTCRYPLLGVKTTVRCDCHPGWGGELCSLPCDKSCVHGRCVLLSDNRKVCLCKLGFVGDDCSRPGYDVIALLNLARLLRTVAPLLAEGGELQAVNLSLQNSQSVQVQQNVHGSLVSGTKYVPSGTPGEAETTLVSSSSSLSSSSLSSSSLAAAVASSAGSSTPSPPTSLPPTVVTGTRGEVHVSLVDNPRRQMELNVQQGSSQCSGNFVCLNGGRCVKGTFGGYRCQCVAPYTGTFCQNSCSKTCYNGGRCVKLRQPLAPDGGEASRDRNRGLPKYRYSFRCSCPQAFTGDQCERPVAGQ